MLSNFGRIIGMGIAMMILFSACMILGIAYFGIDDPYAQVLVGKALSLFTLAAFGQSEALKLYLNNHKGGDLKLLNKLNQVGSVLAILFGLLLLSKIYGVEVDPVAREGKQLAAYLQHIRHFLGLLKKHSELTSLIPLFFFALINLLLWILKDDAKDIGRVCFVVSDIPVLLPMSATIWLISTIVGYGSKEYKLLVAGATIMLIFTSIILTECTKELLYTDGNDKLTAGK